MSIAYDILPANHTKRNLHVSAHGTVVPKPIHMHIRRLTYGFMFILFITASGTGCKKAVEDNARRVLLDLMTNGRWMVQIFTEAGTDHSADYAAWEFQFYENGTVDGLNGTQKVSGTWSVDEVNYTIRSTFPVGSPSALMRLSETWNMTKTTLNYVEAKPSNTARTAYLKLVRK
jgi:hypothetical protein